MVFTNWICRNLSLLSFGEEAEEEEKEVALVKKKIVSSHDVLNDPRLLKEETPNTELVISSFLKFSFWFSNKTLAWHIAYNNYNF